MTVMMVTGASSGIGRATARLAVEHGYQVVLGARDEPSVVELATELGRDAVGLRCDVRRWEDLEAMARRANEAFGSLDIAVANAGIGSPRGFLAGDVDTWQAMIDTNVLGTALTIRAALPFVLESEAGHIVLTSSVAGRRVTAGSLYASTKAAVSAMGDSLRQELRAGDDHRTRVTVIEPGWVDTSFLGASRPGSLDPLAIAEATLYAVSRPANVDVNTIAVRPSVQLD